MGGVGVGRPRRAGPPAGPRSRGARPPRHRPRPPHPPARHRRRVRLRGRPRAVRAGGGDRAVARRATPPSARSWPSRWARAGSARGSPPPRAVRRPPSASWRSCSAPATPAPSATRSTARSSTSRASTATRSSSARPPQVPLTNPDREGEIRRAATEWAPESVLRRLEAVLACRTAMDQNVKPEIAVEAMMTALQRG